MEMSDQIISLQDKVAELEDRMEKSYPRAGFFKRGETNDL
jgi:hypothetical protein